MTNFRKVSALAFGMGLVSFSAHASFTANDIYLGFNQSSASSDYLIDLGQPGTAGVGGSSVVNLNSAFSLTLFNSTFASGPTGVSVGAVGGQSQFPSSYDLYVTSLRVGGAGNPALAGSDLSGFNHSQGTIANAVSAITGVAFPSVGSGVADSGKSWTADVSPTFTVSSFYGNSGIDPSSAINGTGVIHEDLWKTTANSAYSYQGYFTFDLSGGSPNLTFTPSAAAVPEPSTFGLFALAGFLSFVSFRAFKRRHEATL